MSSVIYARVPDTVKEAADNYAQARGVTLTAAVVDLLERGLAAVSDEQSVAGLQLSLATARAENAELRSLVDRNQAELGALEVVRQRSGQVLATCPGCTADVTVYQVLAVGRCQACGHRLSDMLTASGAAAGVDQREMLLLIGMIGALVGAAWLTTKSR